MNDEEKINIIVPVYNVELYLPKCIESLLSQTYTNIHIFLIDDGSTDPCPAICDSYAEQDSRVTVIHRSNGGQSAARNSGLAALSDEAPENYVAFVDSDDYVEPDYLAFLYKLLKENNADIAQCGHYIVYSEKRYVPKNKNCTLKILDQKCALESLCYNGIYDVTAWNKLYKLSLFSDLRFPEGRIYEDTASAPYITSKANRIVVNMTPKYYYVQRYNSTANGRKFHKNKYQFLQAGDELADYVSFIYPELTKAANVKRVFVRLSTLSQMVNADYYDRQAINEMRKIIIHYAPDVLWNTKSSVRDKFGTLLFLTGFSNYRRIWKYYDKIMRRK